LTIVLRCWSVFSIFYPGSSHDRKTIDYNGRFVRAQLEFGANHPPTA
jgi:hypothetical protein